LQVPAWQRSPTAWPKLQQSLSVPHEVFVGEHMPGVMLTQLLLSGNDIGWLMRQAAVDAAGLLAL
jgi:hypothetical protein